MKGGSILGILDIVAYELVIAILWLFKWNYLITVALILIGVILLCNLAYILTADTGVER